MGCPLAKAAMFSVAVFMSLPLASVDAQAMCGVVWQFFAPISGQFVVGGSSASTSMPAACNLSELSASASACSSTNGPRPVFMSMADGFIKARRSVFTRW